ncbi:MULTISPECIES: hypothetical protein [Fructobacillus]|uniref:Uncharacterized protein n=1 Tax=Fructobacillus cardui TaxID=2893170 RepID=A0ABM9MQN9_9LACO|nr:MULTISPECIES: hypothetical protein [Fructobacillus]KMK53156.1 hypothetical protein FEFB_10840 [Fructobacillus sp. EFB-N1]MCK8626687.1 hypothetical protein [Fructobacillus cardui]CAK1232261.1 unnamed protein product [Fructobacillus cardui]
MRMSELQKWLIDVGDKVVRLAFTSKDQKQPESEHIVINGGIYKITIEKL